MTIFRSKFEERFNKNTGGTLDYEKVKLRYTIPAKEHTYTPDFNIKGTNIFFETKGIFDASDRKKMLLVKEQHPDKRIILVFMKATTPIAKKSKTTYADWCDKNNLEWMTSIEAEEFMRTCS